MTAKGISIEKLGSELFADITRAHLALLFHRQVIIPLVRAPDFLRDCGGVFRHLSVSTLTLAFMTLARMYDEPTSRFSVTLQQLVDGVARDYANDPEVVKAAKSFTAQIKAYRKKLARLRSTVFAHKVHQDSGGLVRWADLETGCDLSKSILEWYGQQTGDAYSYRVPGFETDCQRFVEENTRRKGA